MTDDIIVLITETLLGEIRGNMGLVIQITAIAFICAIYRGFGFSGGIGSEITRSAFLVEYGLVATLLGTSIVTVSDIAVTTISRMTDAMNAATPVLMAMSVYTGNISQTASMGAVFLTATQITTNLIKSFFLPAAVMIAVMSIVNNFTDKINISQFTDLLKNIVIWGLGLVMTIYLAVLSIQSILSVSSDTAMRRTLRFAAGSMVPFVGQYLSESMDAIGASAVAMNSIAGTGVMMSIITITIAPAVKILLIAGMLKLSASIIQPVANERITKCISQTAMACSLVAGLIIVCAAIFTITIGAIINTAMRVVGM